MTADARSPFPELERHLIALGAAPTRGDRFDPVGDDVWATLFPKRTIPAALRWFLRRFGGVRFPGGVFYSDPPPHVDPMIGWFLGGDEVVRTHRDYEGAIRRDVVLISNDGADNHLAVGLGHQTSGVVYFHIHDAPLDRNLHLVDRSFEHFLAGLHRER